MPRFLNTYTGQFHWVEDPSKLVYAILSHTWQSEADGGEQSYAELLELQQRHGIAAKPRLPQDAEEAQSRTPISNDSPPRGVPLSLTNPYPIFSDTSGLSPKIRGVCKVAREAGYELVWVDSGCIDKSSSAELAEAINSMFELYKLADVCYVYLTDVSTGADAQDEDSEFWRSRWHRRGWTLQELIAPKDVVFLDKSWRFFGTKYGLAGTLERVTRVDLAILTGIRTLDSISVARRMSWAATRETTRVEDEAYSLLGIFGVHLSPIYGEGRNAFLRLQEEIIKYIPDQTIFVWGTHRLAIDWETHDMQIESSPNAASEDFGHGLFASSPRPFRDTGDTVALTPAEFASRISGLGLPDGTPPSLHCVITPEGARLDLFTIAVQEGVVWDPLAPYLGPHLTIGCQLEGSIDSLALLPCEVQPDGSLVALILFRPSQDSDQNRGLFVTSTRMDHAPLCYEKIMPACRFVLFPPPELRAMCPHFVVRVAEKVVLRSSSTALPKLAESPARARSVNLWTRPSQPNDAPIADVRVAPWTEERLRVLGFGLTPIEVHRSHDQDRTILATYLTVPGASTEPRRHVPIIKIQLTLARTTHIQFPVRALKVKDTAALFAVSVVPTHSSKLSTGTADADMWRVANANGEETQVRTFSSEDLEVTAREREVVGTLFLIDYGAFDEGVNGDALQKHVRACNYRRRMLRIALECPRESCLDSGPPESRVPYLLLSIELSDSRSVSEVAPDPVTTHTDDSDGQARCVPETDIHSTATHVDQEAKPNFADINSDTPAQAESTSHVGPSKHVPARFGLRKLFRNMGAQRRS